MTEAEKERAAIWDHIAQKVIDADNSSWSDWRWLLWVIMHPFEATRFVAWNRALLGILAEIEDGEHLKEGR